ncbi:hypothetical protein BD414DRAFT_140615 [Trametes punicea]|nr:hypothetical protein BD414DRAFT_140615 [Trametes punicea]
MERGSKLSYAAYAHGTTFVDDSRYVLSTPLACEALIRQITHPVSSAHCIPFLASLALRSFTGSLPRCLSSARGHEACTAIRKPRQKSKIVVKSRQSSLSLLMSLHQSLPGSTSHRLLAFTALSLCLFRCLRCTLCVGPIISYIHSSSTLVLHPIPRHRLRLSRFHLHSICYNISVCLYGRS